MAVRLDPAEIRKHVAASFAAIDDTEMWLTVEQRDALRTLAAVKPAIASRHESFCGVRVTSDEYGACAWATNGTIAIRVDLPWLDGSPAPFDALVSHAELVQALRVIGRGPVMLEAYLDGGHCGLRLDADHTTMTLCGLPPEDYPAEGPFAPHRDLFTMGAGALATVLDRAIPCASTEREPADRLVLTGVCLDPNAGDHPAVLASDLHKLCELPLWATPEPGAPSVILPAADLAPLVKRLHAAAGEHVTVSTARPAAGFAPSEQFVSFEVSGEMWSIRALDRRFPEWRHLVPVKTRALARIDLDAAEVIQSCDDSMAMMSGTTGRLMIERVNGVARVVLRVENESGMEFAHELVEADIQAGRSKKLTVGLNPAYLAQCARALGHPRLLLTVYHPQRALIMQAASNRCLLMPIKLHR